MNNLNKTAAVKTVGVIAALALSIVVLAAGSHYYPKLTLAFLTGVILYTLTTSIYSSFVLDEKFQKRAREIEADLYNNKGTE